MKISSFKATNVHGYLNYDMEFFPELTFLIGINGSGKTTALKLILGLISPSYQYLNEIEYDFAELICSSSGSKNDIKITARKNSEDNTFSIELLVDEHKFDPAVFNMYNHGPEFTQEQVSLKEQTYKEEFEHLSITNEIRNLATPKFLGLDRRIYEGRSIDTDIILRDLKRNRYQKMGRKIGYPTAIDRSLDEVQHLIFTYFRKIASEQPKISEDFKKKIFELSFKFHDDHSLESIPTSASKILEKRKKVLAALEKLDMSFLNASANGYFSKMENIITENQEIKNQPQKRSTKSSVSIDNASEFKTLMKWINNSSQMKRIDEIIKFSQTYQEKLEGLRSPIFRLEKIASKFLLESKKKIKITEDGTIQVVLANGKKSSVFELSSGEKQITIMIAHLIFEEDLKPSGIFIIDEPELSLHIAWQEIFIDSITEASPNTQFILATHSPSIISRVNREQFCQDLNKLNS